MRTKAVVIQCFIKTDTLQGLCESLLRCRSRESFDLIFWCDSPVDNPYADYTATNAAVMSFLEQFCKAGGQSFASCSIFSNDQNLRTCKTCEVALDYAFKEHDFAIFTEDDTVFSTDALQWFEACAETADFMADDVWAIAGESICFNAQKQSVEDLLVEKARLYALERGLYGAYTKIGFLPSTCFATTAAKWSQFSQTRGQPLGDEDVNARCRDEGKSCIFPVVPRVKDIGMLHPLGYSVTLHSAENVNEVKNTYLMSDDIADDGETVSPFLLQNGAGDAFARSTKFLNFD